MAQQMDLISLGVVDPSDTWGLDLRMRLPGADSDAMDRELVSTVQEFLQKAGSMRVWVSSTFNSADPAFSFEEVPTTPVPANASWGGVRGLFLHQVRMDDGRALRLLDHRPRGAWDGTEGSPVAAYTAQWPGSVELIPRPSAGFDGQRVHFEVTLILRRPVTMVPAILAQWNYNAILDGATGRMMAHPKRPYSDIKLAEYYLRRFRNEMRVATDEAHRRWSNAETSFSFNPDWSRKP